MSRQGALALLGVSMLIASAYGSSWEVVHKQTPEADGGPGHPSIRYGHTSVGYNNSILSTHGYYYDRESGSATWLSDTWTMSAQPPYNWTQLSGHLPHEDAHARYNQGRVPSAPCGRFGHDAAVSGDNMYLYGGHDGGLSRHGRQNYEPGYDFEELWLFKLGSRTWSLLPPAAGTSSPGKRYLLAMTAVQQHLLLYGGMMEGNGDVWAYDTVTARWEELSKEVKLSEGGPGRRVGHSIIPLVFPQGPTGFLLFGGRTVEASVSKLHNDVWFFDMDSRAWRVLHNATEVPPARTYHALAHTHLPQVGSKAEGGKVVLVGIIGGGTLTTPGLTCAEDAWAFTVDCGVKYVRWYRLPDLPVPAYDLSSAAVGTDAFVFGGHLCNIEKAQMPFYYVNVVGRLDLLEHLPTDGCELPLSQATTAKMEL